MPSQATPSELTMTLLHKIQDARTNPENGWLTVDELLHGMVLNVMELPKVNRSLAELEEAGMITRKTERGQNYWRSRGIKPEIGRTREEAARDLMAEAIEEVDRRVPSIFTVVLPAGRRLGSQRHAAFLLGQYPEPLWFTQCGLPVPAEKMTEIREQMVTCPPCNDNLRRSEGVRAMLAARAAR